MGFTVRPVPAGTKLTEALAVQARMRRATGADPGRRWRKLPVEALLLVSILMNLCIEEAQVRWSPSSTRSAGPWRPPRLGVPSSLGCGYWAWMARWRTCRTPRRTSGPSAAITATGKERLPTGEKSLY